VIEALERILEETVDAALDAQRTELQAVMDRNIADLTAALAGRLKTETAAYRKKRDFWRTAAFAGYAAAAVSVTVTVLSR
jgi:hypothetical protein